MPKNRFSIQLFNAVRKNRIDKVQRLLTRGARVNYRDNSGHIPLHFAASPEIASLLLRAGADVHARDCDADTSLHGTMTVELASLLVEHGADINAVDDIGYTPLSYAIDNDNLIMAQFYLQHGALPMPVGERDQTALHGVQSPGMVDFLLQTGIPIDLPDEYGDTPLHCAAQEGSEEVVASLLAHGASIEAKNAGGQTPLYKAIGVGAAEVVNLLLTYGARVDIEDHRGYTPLHHAAIWHDEDIIAHKSSMDTAATIPKAFADHAVIAELLLKHGADPNATGQDMRTPLHCAVLNGFRAVAQKLLDTGANPALRDREGHTPPDYIATPVPFLHWEGVRKDISGLQRLFV